MALIDQYTMASSATFKSRVEQAILVRVRAQIGGADSGSRSLYQTILFDAGTLATHVTKAVVADATLATRATADSTGATATDAEIQAAVNAALPFFVR